MEKILSEVLFWSVWLIIPLLVDLVGCIGAWIKVTFKKKEREPFKLEYFPVVTIIVPVFNSAETLKACIQSIEEQNYPLKQLEVFLINNGSKDQSYDLYCAIQNDSKLKMWWLDASQGKGKALNKGLYLAKGKYIVNIDSDGVLDGEAIRNMVKKFESDPEIDALTGIVMLNQEMIQQTEHLGIRLLQKCEFFEYMEAFLVGRAYEAYHHRMFTLAGAFSAFKKKAVLKSQLYNFETIGEDTHMTTQIREFAKGKVGLSEDAYFLVEPIESIDKLYIQRQRWQRGAIEVGALFEESSKRLSSVLNRVLIKDHTLVFPRLIWMFAMFYLIFMDYPLGYIVGANVILYCAYVLCSFLFLVTALKYLKERTHTTKYMRKHCYAIILLPLYRMLLFFIRVAGIINAVETKTSWNKQTFTEEKIIMTNHIHNNFSWYFKMKEWMNNG